MQQGIFCCAMETTLKLAGVRPFPVFAFQPLQIKSVVAKEGLKGYIYIEAYKQTHVKHAIEGIGNLRIGYYQQQVSTGRFDGRSLNWPGC